MQDDLTFRRKYKKKKNPSGDNQNATKTSTSADSESTLAASGDDNDNKKDLKNDPAVAEKEVRDDSEVSGRLLPDSKI